MHQVLHESSGSWSLSSSHRNLKRAEQLAVRAESLGAASRVVDNGGFDHLGYYDVGDDAGVDGGDSDSGETDGDVVAMVIGDD